MDQKIAGSQAISFSTGAPQKHASKDAFGEPLRKMGSSPVKYGNRTKSKSVSSPSARPMSSDGTASSGVLSRTPSRKRPFPVSSDDSGVDISSPLSPLTPLNPVSGSKSKPRTTSNVSPTRNSESQWRVENLGGLVWVRVSETGDVFEPEFDDDVDFIWWPGRITNRGRNQITVRPYGALGPSLTTILIRSPSSENVLSFADSTGQPRFTSQSFRNSNYIDLGSPRKKVKRAHQATESNWAEALREVLKDDDDGLPPITTLEAPLGRSASASAAHVSNSRKRNGKSAMNVAGKVKTQTHSDVDELDSESDWEPPEPDETLTVPGELILCRERAEAKLYWPAKILGFKPPPKPKGKARPKEPKYNIIYMDGTKQAVPRGWFYACDEEGFGTCLMGKFESQYVDNPDSVEDEDAQTADVTRSPSPIPLSSLSSGFGNLSIREQLGYMKPVLLAILNDKYAPAKDRHDDFMKGGKARAGLGGSAGLRGMIPPGDIEKLQKHLCDWCLRDEMRACNNTTEEEDLVKPEAERPQPLDDIDKADVLIADSGTPVLPSQSAKEEEKSSLSKDLTISILRSSPTLPDSDLPSSPSPSLPPPSSSLVSLVSEDNDSISEIPGDKIQKKSERQKGCEAYEHLSGVEKISYCLAVLLPEAVLQLLLLRNGYRASIELLSDFEEAELHAKAEELAQETDWVFDIMRLRETRISHLNKKASDSKQNDTSAGISVRQSSRPRRTSSRF